jgi:hypothetical protein
MQAVSIPTRPRSVPGAVVASLLLCACAPRQAPRTTPDVTSATAAERRHADSSAAGQRTLGIPPFAVAGGRADSVLAPLSYALADLLTTDLARSRRVQLVERTRLGEVLRELDLAASGRVDSASAPRVGRLVQARQLLVGSVTALPGGRAGGDLRLGVRIADVQTGTVEGAIDASAPLADILAAEKALAFRLFDRLGVVLAPDERAAVEQRPTATLAALLAYGEGVRREYLGDFRGAAAAYRRAVRLDPRVRAAADRQAQARTMAEAGVANPAFVPGLRAVDAIVGLTIDRLNRPLDPIATFTPNGRSADPAFPTTAATVVITVNRP